MGKVNIRKIKQIPDKEILRGKFYWSAIPYSEKRPLYVFCKNKKNNYGKREMYVNPFNNGIYKNGEVHSDVIDVIIRHKRRLSLVVQADTLNEDVTYPFVYVVPITTFDGDLAKIHYVRDNNNDIIQYHYIGEITGKESVANISDIKRIHKSLLLEKTNIEQIDSDTIENIGKKIAQFMEIDKIEKCKECMYNYENYMDKSIIKENKNIV